MHNALGGNDLVVERFDYVQYFQDLGEHAVRWRNKETEDSILHVLERCYGVCSHCLRKDDVKQKEILAK